MYVYMYIYIYNNPQRDIEYTYLFRPGTHAIQEEYDFTDKLVGIFKSYYQHFSYSVLYINL